MKTITSEFFKNSSIPKNQDSEAAMEFLTRPENVNLMLSATQMGLPALAGVVAELEEKFANCKLFPLNHEAGDANAPHRRNVGWMVRHVMGKYGYTPAKGMQLNERTRLGRFAKFFGTAAIYEKTIKNPEYQIEIRRIP
ncbi:hypothetical protein ABDB91_12365 [Desulfoscipio sp. XC116]|uniref:hypothetical protein n=1 Tax=Desulfoscipio sp. XC116 TaxID=3144975 RepID=UPI00325A60B5